MPNLADNRDLFQNPNVFMAMINGGYAREAAKLCMR